MIRIPSFTIVAAVAAAPLAACVAHSAPEAAAQGAQGTESCISVDRIVSRRPEGPRSLRFEMVGGAVYRNVLDRACPSLEQATDFDIITLRLDGSRACYGDEFQIVEPAEARAVGFSAFPRCRLGRFERAEAAN